MEIENKSDIGTLEEYTQDMEMLLANLNVNEHFFGETEIHYDPIPPNMEITDIPISELLEFYFELELSNQPVQSSLSEESNEEPVILR
jgi:hypothetical protein